MDTSPQKPVMNPDSPEQLLDAFKAAALSVTRLYKTSAAAQAKARTDGYQDCLDDLLTFLDKESIGLGDGEGWKIRRWATERLDGRDTASQQAMESEDDADKAETASSPELQRSTVPPNYTAPRTDSAPPPSIHHAATSTTTTAPTTSSLPDDCPTMPTQDTFTFQSPIPYPQEPNLTLASLDLSDSRPTAEGVQAHSTAPAAPTSRVVRGRHIGGGPRSGPRTAGRLGKGAGQKRRNGDDLADIFNISSLGYGKDFFADRKRSRHT